MRRSTYDNRMYIMSRDGQKMILGRGVEIVVAIVPATRTAV
jgi:hypothetical protein